MQLSIGTDVTRRDSHEIRISIGYDDIYRIYGWCDPVEMTELIAAIQMAVAVLIEQREFNFHEIDF